MSAQSSDATSVIGRLDVSVEIGDVGTRWMCPRAAVAVLTLAHGAGAGMESGTMRALADALAARHIATLRFNFPFMERPSAAQHRARVDPRPVATQTIAAAAQLAGELAPTLPLFLAGHSFGGRMSSHAWLEHRIDRARGLVFCAFPLHPAGKPSIERAAHLAAIDRPMLFLSGTRDALAEPHLLDGVIARLGSRAERVRLETADHSYKVLKRERTSTVPIFDEMADAIAAFCVRVAPEAR